MLKIYIAICILLLISACRKSETSCTSCNTNCSHQNGDITGNWKLESFRSYSAPGNLNPAWNNADPGKPVSIHFTFDSLFSFGDNFTWDSDGYDRYKMTDSADFIIYSSSSLLTRPLFGAILSSNEIELRFMGVDAGTEEKFSCY